MSFSISPVRSSRDRRAFIGFPYDLYKGHPFWIPTLRMDIAKAINPKKNAFFDHGTMELFLARDGDRVLGRIAAIQNGMHLRKFEDQNGFFGFFDVVDDYEVASALLDAASEWLRSRGMTGVRGPTNPSMNDVAGLLVGGFDRRPSILMPYNEAYYVDFIERYGFTRAMTMWAYYVHRKYLKLERLERGADLVRRRHPSLQTRTLDMSRFDEEAQTVLELYNAAWSNNWGHVPMTAREFAQLAKDLKSIVEPEMVIFLELDGKPIAFSILIPNLNQALRHVPDGRLFPLGLPKLLAYAKLGAVYETRMPLLGVLPEFHGKGFDALMIVESIRNGEAAGFDASEMSWVLDVNKPLLNALDNVNAVRDKEYAMYEKQL